MNVEAGTTAYRVALPEFEGPLDLLLHLCKTHEIEIVNIPIAFITTKYLEYLEIMSNMPVDVAADYLVMAATLAYLKSRELVPAPEPLEVAQLGDGEEELGDPRQELIRRLLEYQKYKDAGEKLAARPIEGRNVFPRGSVIELADVGPAGNADESVWKLIEAFGRILEKAGPVSTHNVVVDRVSIGDRINQLVDRLQNGGGTFRFESCFDLSLPEHELRHQVVVTLLAILELAKMKAVRILQAPAENGAQGELLVTHVAGADLEAARRVHVTSAGDGVELGGDPDAEASEEQPEAEMPVEAQVQSNDADDAAAVDIDGVEDDTDGGTSVDAAAAGHDEDEDDADSTLVEEAPAGAGDPEAGEVGEK
jgi:segregation and condensation protein A